MDVIRRMDFKKNNDAIQEFEILTLSEFFKKRSFHHIYKNFRLNFNIMMYITSGTGRHEIDFIEYDLKPGTILFIAQNQVHRFIEGNETKGYILFFTRDFLYNRTQVFIKDFFNQFNMPINQPVLSVGDSSDSTSKALIQIIHKEYCQETKNKYLIDLLFSSFIIAISSQTSLDNNPEYSTIYKRFIEFRDLVEQHYKLKKTVHEYAQMMLVTEKTINKTTRSVVDLSAKQFIIDRILLEIKRYLSQGELTINEISDLMGFDEPSNFTKFFKRYEDMSPNEFKKKAINR